MLYSSVGVAIFCSLYAWLRYWKPYWRNLALIVFVVPLMGPFDDFWHRMFGAEDFTTPLVVWSPPHLIAALATLFGLIQLLKILHQEKDIDVERFFGGLSFAAIISLVLFLTSPLYPRGPYELLGFWGAGFVSFFYIGTLVIASHWMKGMAGALLLPSLELWLWPSDRCLARTLPRKSEFPLTVIHLTGYYSLLFWYQQSLWILHRSTQLFCSLL